MSNHWKGKLWYAYGTSMTSIQQGEYVPIVEHLSGLEVVNKRILRMKKEGFINYFTIVTNPKKLDKTITAFIFLVMQYGDSIKSLLEYADSESDVLECYSVTGEYDYMLKICAKDIESLEDKILYIKNNKGVMKSHTMISLMEHKFVPTILPDMED